MKMIMGQSLNYRGLLVVGVCLPAVLASADRLILTSISGRDLSPAATVALFSFFVVQVAIVSWAVPRFINPWPLRWFLWVWTMALVDLQLGALSAEEGFASRRAIDSLGAAMLAGQLGAIVVWGILGGGVIRWRILSLLILFFVLLNFYGLLMRAAQQPNAARFGWEDLLLVETTVLACLCVAIRCSGFRLSVLADDDAQSRRLANANPALQFSIRHVFIGTTVLALLLGLAKAGDLLTAKFLQRLSGESTFFVVSVASCTAMVLLVALWAALGRGNWLVRATVAIVLPLCSGGAIAWYCLAIGQPQMRSFLVNTPYWMFVWYETGYWWIGFMVLTATLLASSLIIFRTLGYRLVRVPSLESVKPHGIQPNEAA